MSLNLFEKGKNAWENPLYLKTLVPAANENPFTAFPAILLLSGQTGQWPADG
jgi:hypothetical protein